MEGRLTKRILKTKKIKKREKRLEVLEEREDGQTTKQVVGYCTWIIYIFNIAQGNFRSHYLYETRGHLNLKVSDFIHCTIFLTEKGSIRME